MVVLKPLRLPATQPEKPRWSSTQVNKGSSWKQITLVPELRWSFVPQSAQVTHVQSVQPVSTFSPLVLFHTPVLLHVCLRQFQRYNNDVRTPLPHFPPLGGTHLVKPGAADRTAGLLMIIFSRCPVVLYPLTFPSEENSRWTAAAPSQMPFLLLLLPQQTC